MTKPQAGVLGGMRRSAFACTYLIVATPLSIILGLALGKYVLPISQAAFIFPLYIRLVSGCGRRRAVVLMTGWAALTALVMVLLGLSLEGFLKERILLGEQYREEMYFWIRTGLGPEGDIRQFLPQHVFHLLIFVTLTALSAGFLGLVMGSVLMNYMSYYVAGVIAHSSGPLAASLLAWPPWAAIRVAAYIIIAIPLSAVSLSRIQAADVNPREVLLGLRTGLGLLVLDVLLKWQLAPQWRQWLAGLTNL